MPTPTPFITPGYTGGINPTYGHTAGSAYLDGTGVTLTDGVANQVGAFFHAIPVSTVGDWTATFRLDFDVAVGGTRRAGGLFLIHGSIGSAPGWVSYTGIGNPSAAFNQIGSQITTQVGVFFRCDDGVSQTGYFQGFYGRSDLLDTLTHDGGSLAPDFTTGHTFLFTLHRTPPSTSGGADGTLVFSVKDESTNQTWTRTYTGLTRLELFFRLPKNAADDPDAEVPGDRANLGFIAVNSTGNNRIRVLGLTWDQPGADLSLDSSATWTAPGTSADRLNVTASIVSSAGSTMLRNQSMALTVKGGQTYSLKSDGLATFGAAFPTGHRYRVVTDATTHVGNLIGNNLGDPTDAFSLLSGIALNGVGVARDGTELYVGSYGGDTTSQAGVNPMDVSTGAVLRADVAAVRQITQVGNDIAVDDGTGFYYTVENDDGAFGPVAYHLVRSKKGTSATERHYMTSCTGTLGTVNADGSTIVSFYRNPDIHVLELESVATSPAPAIRYNRITSVDVAGSVVAVAFKALGKVSGYDKASFLQVGATISLPYAQAVAILGNGNFAVAHGASGGATAATVVSVCNPTTGAVIRVMSELGTLGDVVSLSYANGLLAVADDGAGIKSVRVFSITANTATGTPVRTIGSPATFGSDNGVSTFWRVVDAAIDNAGNCYVCHQPAYYFASSSGGGQLLKFGPTGSLVWSKEALGYTTAAVGGPPSDPTLALSSNLRRYRLDLSTGAGTYIGSAAYPGYDTRNGFALNVISTVGTGQCAAPMRWAALGGHEFLAIPPNTWDRLPIFRHTGDGYLHCCAVVYKRYPGNAKRATWVDTLGDGYPLESQLTFSDPPGYNSEASILQLAENGDIWFTESYYDVWRLPFGGLDGNGNPTWDWSTAYRVTSPATTPYNVLHGLFLSASPQGPYILIADPDLAPAVSIDAGGGSTAGGCRTLIALSPSGAIRWTMLLPETCQSLDAVDGWACVGGITSSRYWLIRSDGQLVREIPPATEDDFLDFNGGSLTLTKLPDGRLVILTESINRSGQVIAVVTPDAAAKTYSAVAVPGQTVALTLDDGFDPDADPDPDPAAGDVRFVLRMSSGVPVFRLATTAT